MRAILVAIVCVLAATLAFGLVFAPHPAPQVVATAAPKEKSIASQEYRTDPCYPPEGKFVGWRNCLKLGRPERFRGVWYSAFAEDFFVGGADTAPAELDLDPPELTIALDIDRKVALSRAGQRMGAWCIRAFAVDFTGRRPTEDMTAFDLRPEKLVLIDKLQSVKYLHNVKLRGVPANEQDCARTPNPMAGLGQ